MIPAAPGKPTVRIAVIGVMGKGAQHARHAQGLAGGALSAVVDRNPAAAGVAAELGVPFFSDVEELIRSGTSDAVICAVPHPVHRQVEVPCLEAGLHVLSEKPLAATPSDARAIVDAAHKHKRTLGMMFQYRQRPAVVRARQLMDAGEIGPWYYATMHHGINRTQDYYAARSWRGTWAGEGGGVLVNQAPHPIDVMMHLVGGFPKRVTCFNNHLRHRMQTEDISTAVLEYENGAQIAMHADTIQLPQSEWWSVYGDKGQLRMENRQVVLTRIDPDLPAAIASKSASGKSATVDSSVQTFDETGPDAQHKGMIQDFVDAVHENRPPLVGGEWALQCVELHAALLTSGITGHAVNFPPDHREYDELLRELKRHHPE